MTREEMLIEIDFLRLPSQGGHKIGITGGAGEWRCEFDAAVGKGTTPVEAYLAAKELGMARP